MFKPFLLGLTQREMRRIYGEYAFMALAKTLEKMGMVTMDREADGTMTIRWKPKKVLNMTVDELVSRMGSVKRRERKKVVQ